MSPKKKKKCLQKKICRKRNSEKKLCLKNIFAGIYEIHQKTRPKQGPDKVKVRWRQSNHNLDLNYNLMGFDTIEINLVLSKIGHEGVLSELRPVYNQDTANLI